MKRIWEVMSQLRFCPKTRVYKRKRSIAIITQDVRDSWQVNYSAYLVLVRLPRAVVKSLQALLTISKYNLPTFTKICVTEIKMDSRIIFILFDSIISQ